MKMIEDACPQEWEECIKFMKITIAIRKVSQHACSPYALHHIIII